MPDDSDFEVLDDSEAEAGSSSDESMEPEYRPHVKNRELNDDWEDQVDDQRYNRAGLVPDFTGIGHLHSSLRFSPDVVLLLCCPLL
jgi:hypothetical protein